MYAILEKQAKLMQEGKKPMLPLWLSPIQVRVIPVSEEYLDYALYIAGKLEGLGLGLTLMTRMKG